MKTVNHDLVFALLFANAMIFIAFFCHPFQYVLVDLVVQRGSVIASSTEGLFQSCFSSQKFFGSNFFNLKNQNI